MATGDILGIGTSGLLAFQSSLATTSHNIANVNTEGYNRQRVELDTRIPIQTGAGFFGNGVDVTTVTRVFDQFLTTQISLNTSIASQYDTYHNFATQVDNLLGDASIGLSTSLQDFFNSFQQLADDPTSVPIRQVVLSEAQSLADRFHFLDERLNSIESGIKTLITNEVDEINAIALNIAEINQEIVTLQGVSGRAPNDLLDQRDRLIQQLSDKVSVSTVPQDDGTVNVFIGNGQNLVVGGIASTLAVEPSEFDPQQLEITFTNRSDTQTITKFLNGGTLGGALSVQDEVLDVVRNRLGLMSVGLAELVNNQNNVGLDLNGNFGVDFFSRPAVSVDAANSNTGLGAVSATFDDVSGLKPTDYLMTYEGGTTYRLVRQSDKANFIINTAQPIPVIDGLQFSIAPGSAVGDQYLIRPFNLSTSGFAVTITDTSDIAAASPVLAESSLLNAGNTTATSVTVTDVAVYQAAGSDYTVTMANLQTPAVGGGEGVPAGASATLQYDLTINGVNIQSSATDPAIPDIATLAGRINAETANTGVRAVVDSAGTGLYLFNDPPGAQPIQIVESLSDGTGAALAAGDTATGFFGGVLTAAGGETSLTSATTLTSAGSYLIENGIGTLVADGAYTAGGTISFNGIDLVVSGTGPGLGDQIALSRNVGGVGDNRNALALAGLQTNLLLNGGTADFQSAYGQMVADVATNTRRADVNAQAQNALLGQIKDQREEISGVNLDEEAANMIRFQQAYQAAAQVIATGRLVFDTLVGVISR